MISCVYQIKNIVTGDIYIGSTKSYRTRKNNHLTHLRTKKHCNIRLSNAFEQYGEIAFEFTILEECEDLIIREQYYIDTLRPQYNIFRKAYIVAGENHPMFGRNHTEASRLKIKNARAKQTISHSQETKNKIGSAHKGRPMKEGHMAVLLKSREGLEPWNKGVKTGISPINKIQIDPKLYVERYLSGESIETIRLSLKVSWDTVKRSLTEYGIITRTLKQQRIVYESKRKSSRD